MIEVKDGYKFECSGREFYANNGIIGIDARLQISEGYDGMISIFDEEDHDAITKEEATELANFMINLWTKYRDD